jgi:hypothetical protein
VNTEAEYDACHAQQFSIVLLRETLMDSAALDAPYATLACRPVCNNDLWHSQCSMFLYDL